MEQVTGIPFDVEFFTIVFICIVLGIYIIYKKQNI